MLAQRINQITMKGRALIQDRIVSGMGWMAGAELAIRVTRLASTILLARVMTPEIFGEAALALAVFEIIRLFNENGLGAAVIRARNADLASVAETAYRLSWVIALFLTLLQVGIGGVVSAMSGRDDLFWLIAALAGVYLFMPAGCVHAWMIMRREGMARMAGVNAAQLLVDNALTLGLALAGFEVWAIVLPKLLTAPIWLIGMAWGRPWRRDRTVRPFPIGRLGRFCGPVLVSELIAGLRLHADKLIIAALFGIEAAGIYFFAFNAGVGLSSAVSTAFNRVVYPRFCNAINEAGGLKASHAKVLRAYAPAFAMVFLIQSVAALVYVPIIFGERWADMAGLAAILCLSGAVRLFAETSLLAFRAAGEPVRECIGAFALAIGAVIGLVLGSSWGLSGAAAGYAAGIALAAAVISHTALSHFARPQTCGAQAL